MKAKLIEKFVSIYGEGGEIRSFFSPGRVNLIGEHTDYNGGHVFPCALSIGTYMIVRKREDRTIRFYTENRIAQTNTRISPYPIENCSFMQSRYKPTTARSTDSQIIGLHFFFIKSPITGTITI